MADRGRSPDHVGQLARGLDADQAPPNPEAEAEERQTTPEGIRWPREDPTMTIDESDVEGLLVIWFGLVPWLVFFWWLARGFSGLAWGIV